MPQGCWITAYMLYLELCDGLLASRPRTGDLDEITRVDPNELGSVFGLVDLSV